MIEKMNMKRFNFLEKVMDLWLQKEKDEMIFGNSYMEITDRKIEIIDPSRVIIKKTKEGYEHCIGDSDSSKIEKED